MKRAGRAPSQVAGGPEGLRKAGCYKTLKKKTNPCLLFQVLLYPQDLLPVGEERLPVALLDV